MYLYIDTYCIWKQLYSLIKNILWISKICTLIYAPSILSMSQISWSPPSQSGTDVYPFGEPVIVTDADACYLHGTSYSSIYSKLFKAPTLSSFGLTAEQVYFHVYPLTRTWFYIWIFQTLTCYRDIVRFSRTRLSLHCSQIMVFKPLIIVSTCLGTEVYSRCRRLQCTWHKN